MSQYSPPDYGVVIVSRPFRPEHNTLSIEQVSAVLDGKPVFGPPREIQEVRNAFAAYEKLEQWSPYKQQHLRCQPWRANARAGSPQKA